MTLIATKDFAVRIPKSEASPDFEQFEYMIGWYNADGGFYTWLFEDFIKRENIDSEVINKRTEPSNIFNDSAKTVELVAEDLTETEFHEISKIIRSKNIWRIFKTSSNKAPEKLGIVTSASEEKKSDQRYNFTIRVQEKSSTLIN